MLANKLVLLFLGICAVVAAASLQEDPTGKSLVTKASNKRQDLKDFPEGLTLDEPGNAATVYDTGYVKGGALVSLVSVESCSRTCLSSAEMYAENKNSFKCHEGIADAPQVPDAEDLDEVAPAPATSAPDKSGGGEFMGQNLCTSCSGRKYNVNYGRKSEERVGSSSTHNEDECCTACSDEKQCNSWAISPNQGCILFKGVKYECESGRGYRGGYIVGTIERREGAT